MKSQLFAHQLDTDLVTNDTSRHSIGIDFHHLNQSDRLKQHKTMKRLHHLSVHTAKQAINEMRLVQVYFSTPNYLLKFREIHQNIAATKESKFIKHQDSNHFWSVTFGDCAIDNFSTSIDTVNLNKYNLIKNYNSVSRTSACSQMFPEVFEKRAKAIAEIESQRESNFSNSSGNLKSRFHI